MMQHDQARSLRRKMDVTNTPRQARTISIISGKGGVGKSNFALNFSLVLIEHGKEVLLLDLDVGMGNIDILLGMHSKKTIIDLFENETPIHDIIETGPKGLDYISAGSGLTAFFQLSAENKNHFYKEFQKLTEEYDYIILDMGAGATQDSLYFIAAADQSFVITTPEPTSITDAYGMVKHIVLEAPDMPISVVMNRSTSNEAGMAALERFQQVVRKFLGREVQGIGMIPEDKHVVQAVIRQMPYTITTPKAPASKALKEITYHYLKNSGQINQTKTSFVQRLKKFIER